jgi:hypothetical protein
LPVASEPIRIGVCECLSPSPTACFVPRIDVLHGMWFEAMNARGGLLGRPVQPVVAYISASSVAKETEMEQATMHFLQQQVQPCIHKSINCCAIMQAWATVRVSIFKCFKLYAACIVLRFLHLSRLAGFAENASSPSRATRLRMPPAEPLEPTQPCKWPN